jgi:SAM-dependent methyltransferase
MSFDSTAYWQARYADGGNSGSGSIGENADFKAHFLNSFVQKHEIESVIEFGCGDGLQLALMNYPHYVGFDVSTTAVNICRDIFSGVPNWFFYAYPPRWMPRNFDLALSLDVTYHLIEDEVFDEHMGDLFLSSNRFVILYTTDSRKVTGHSASHVLHRPVPEYIAERFPGWSLENITENPNPHLGGSDFYVYQR